MVVHYGLRLGVGWTHMHVVSCQHANTHLLHLPRLPHLPQALQSVGFEINQVVKMVSNTGGSKTLLAVRE